MTDTADVSGLIAALGKYRRDTDHYAALGALVAVWSLIEAAVDIETHSLAQLNAETGYCLTAQITGIARKLDAYVSLANLVEIQTELAKALRKFADNSVALAEKRNRYIHDVWVLSNYPETPKRWEATARRKLRHLQIETPTATLWEFGDQLIKHLSRFYELASQISETHGALRKMPPEKTDP